MQLAGPRNEGQALVETAIVMPLYVFLILGLLQLGLAHQARLMTKYAAYQAARAGALHNADPTEMRKAALGVLLPLASKKKGEFEVVKPIKSGSSYVAKWAEYYTMRRDFLVPGLMRIADVVICGPTTDEFGNRTSGEVDFDDPKFDVAAWKTSQETKLRVQVLFNYRMPIPFANAVLEWMNLGVKIPTVLRMKGPTNTFPKFTANLMEYYTLATQGIYVMPIRASYNMRMQSNIYLKNIPKKNKCVVPWSFKK